MFITETKMRLRFFSSSLTSKCVSEVSMQKFSSYHTNRTLDAQDFLHLKQELDIAQLNTLRDELSRAVQHWIIYMLGKTCSKKTFLKHLQVIVNLNKFEFNEEDMKLSGKFLFFFFLFIFLSFYAIFSFC